MSETRSRPERTDPSAFAGPKPKPKLKPKPKQTPTASVRRPFEQFEARAELESSVAVERPLYLYLQVELVPRWAS